MISLSLIAQKTGVECFYAPTENEWTFCDVYAISNIFSQLQERPSVKYAPTR
jgi:hypothetical protein